MNEEELISGKLDIIFKLVSTLEEEEKKLREWEEKITNLKRTIMNLWEMFDICPRCNGEGKYFHRATAEDKGDMVECKLCNSTGKFNKIKTKKSQWETWMFRR